MEPITYICSKVAPLMRDNIDTDIIISVERLTSADLDDIGRWAFEAIRYQEDGAPNPTFEPGLAKFEGAEILLAGRNFGCGSSREPAAAALAQMGFRCVIAESFGDIFSSNCIKNGILPIELGPIEIGKIHAFACSGNEPLMIDVDLVELEIRMGSARRFSFTIGEYSRQMLLTGRNELEMSLQRLPEIEKFQEQYWRAKPWLRNVSV